MTLLLLFLDETVPEPPVETPIVNVSGAGLRRYRRDNKVQMYENIRLPVKSNISFIKTVKTISSILYNTVINVNSSIFFNHNIPSSSMVAETINIETLSDLRFEEKLPIISSVQFDSNVGVTSKLLLDNYNSLFVNPKEIMDIIDDIDSI